MAILRRERGGGYYEGGILEKYEQFSSLQLLHLLPEKAIHSIRPFGNFPDYSSEFKIGRIST